MRIILLFTTCLLLGLATAAHAGEKSKTAEQPAVATEETAPAADEIPATCPKCGEIKGSEKCCQAEGRERCGKCGLFKGSPGCCAGAKAAVESHKCGGGNGCAGKEGKCGSHRQQKKHTCPYSK